MINLFHINHYNIDTSKFDHVLNGSIVSDFESEFCKYVGADYGCGVNSATNAIFLSLLRKEQTVSVPSIIPYVVLNAITLGGNNINFTDDVDWVGDSYILHRFEDYKIIDSAQKVERGQFKKEANPEDLMIFSFYPTKPVGSIDGGMIVSNDKSKIDWFKSAVLNGTVFSKNNWEREILFPGWKSYLSSSQAFVAQRNLEKLEDKNAKLDNIRNQYNLELGLENTSRHLYRISTENRDEFIKKMRSRKITCGIHYKPMHLNKIYCKDGIVLERSEEEGCKTVSIPFHEMLTDSEVSYIIKCCKELL